MHYEPKQGKTNQIIIKKQDKTNQIYNEKSNRCAPTIMKNQNEGQHTQCILKYVCVHNMWSL